MAGRDAYLLASWVDAYVAGRTDVKPATRTHFGHTRRNLVEFFGPDRPLNSITAGDADDWRRALIGQGLADNSVRRRSGIAKQFFRAAIRKKLLADNPFADLKATVQANPAKAFFITRAMADKIVVACPDDQWRLVFALSRYGGLRCPSEHLALRWSDVLWDKGRMLVHSSKTEHHAGGDARWVPIFEELLPHLRAAFEQAEPGTEFVITRYRKPAQNLRTTFMKVIKRAGLTPWPKLVPEPPGDPRDGAGRDVAGARGDQVDRAHVGRGPQALPPGDRGPLRAGGRRGRHTRGTDSGTAHARTGAHGSAGRPRRDGRNACFAG